MLLYQTENCIVELHDIYCFIEIFLSRPDRGSDHVENNEIFPEIFPAAITFKKRKPSVWQKKKKISLNRYKYTCSQVFLKLDISFLRFEKSLGPHILITPFNTS